MMLHYDHWNRLKICCVDYRFNYFQYRYTKQVSIYPVDVLWFAEYQDKCRRQLGSYLRVFL